MANPTAPPSSPERQPHAEKLAQFHRQYRLAVWRIVGIYAFFGAMWIYLSDTILGWIVNDPLLITRLSVYKGLLFILLTTTLLYTLLTRYFKNYQQALRALEQSEERYRALVEQAPDAITVVDLDTGCFVDANSNALRLFECERTTLLTSRPEHFYTPEQPDQRPIAESTRDYGERTFAGELVVLERILCSAKGKELHCEVRLARMPDTQRRLIRASYVDITERKQLEQKLRQAQKMEVFGQLAGGVAHDFNNLLTVIQSYASILEKGGLSEEEQQEFIKEIALAGERATNLTRQLLTFSRRGALHRVDVDLNLVVANITKMLRRLIGEHITLECQPIGGQAMVHADPGMIEQVLVNLAVNARDAMPQGGRLTIKTGRATFTAQDLATDARCRPGEFIALTVEDTGCGIPAENLPRIFEPFFTTKQAGKGTGLGLATVFGIVEQHHGWIQVQSQVGKGTTFHLYLPRLTKPAQPAAAVAHQALPRGTETILLAEDDHSVRHLAKNFLLRMGYKVLEAADGPEALKIWREHHQAIDLLFTDMIMPGGLLGRELAQTLKAEKPSLKIIFCSGFSDDLTGGIPDEPGLVFLQKPYEPERLAKAVRECLDQR